MRLSPERDTLIATIHKATGVLLPDPCGWRIEYGPPGRRMVQLCLEQRDAEHYVRRLEAALLDGVVKYDDMLDALDRLAKFLPK